MADSVLYLFHTKVPSEVDADDPVLAADFLVSEIMTARLLRDPDDDDGGLGDPLEREAAAAARCLGVKGVGDEFFAKAASTMGGKQGPALLKGRLSRWVRLGHLLTCA